MDAAQCPEGSRTRPTTGWISPEGDFYPCNAYAHTEKAREICESLSLDVDPLWGDVRLSIENLGWLHVGLVYGILTVTHDPNEKQAGLLFSWMDQGVEVDGLFMGPPKTPKRSLLF